MAKIQKHERIHNGTKYHHDQYLYFCPGCGHDHAFALKADGGNHTFNMDLNNPTVSPSLLNNFTPGHVCHHYIRQGMIIYLSDCTHHLAGRTIELPDIKTEPDIHFKSNV